MVSRGHESNRGTAHHCKTGVHQQKVNHQAVVALFLATCSAFSVRAHAQAYSPVAITPPVEDAVDKNFVSVLTGKLHFAISAVQLGDVSFTPFSNNDYFTAAADNNYGYVVGCYDPGATTSYTVSTYCVSTYASVQAVWGEELANFQLQGSTYISVASDGATFVDNGSTCTWTKRDGTQIVFAAFHAAGNPNCLSNNISQIVHPDGRIETYYYYGSLSTSTNYTPSPIISIATNSGYLLKYNYAGTPTWGAETSVVAINRAFESCNPTALSCALVNPGWPTATLSWTPGSTTIFTITDEANKKYVFGLDGWGRVVSYQPPEATSPVITYALCTLLSDGRSMSNCWGDTTWTPANGVFDPVPLSWDLVQSAIRNGQTWSYAVNFFAGSPPTGWTTWQHSVLTPLNTQMLASGNSTPGAENFYGPIDSVTHYDGTVDHFERNLQNYFSSRQTAGGILTTYLYNGNNGNLQTITKNPTSGSSLSATNETAVYPTTCSTIVTCYKPTSVTDANGNAGITPNPTTTFTYDPVHGGVTTQTDAAVNTPKVNGVHPQKRYTYAHLNAWYLNSSGVMTEDPNPIYVLATESFCRMGAAVSPPAPPGSGCVLANDEVVTTYEYGANSGPNNLIVRGKDVTADGLTLRTCYGHDGLGNKIWETSPNANPSSCASY